MMRSQPLKPLLVAALGVACATALAAKPDWVSQAGPNAASPPVQARQEIQFGAHFQDRQREAVHRYYAGQRAKGRCPPGLAKKKNGCLPPGLAKKWSRGQPLPTSLVLYPVPMGVMTHIGPPPPGYKYVRVANDLLLVALGTMIVVDGGRPYLGKKVEVVVTSVLQTAAGRMIFTRFDSLPT